MTETERRFRDTLKAIQSECELYTGLHYGTEELELRLKSAALLKVGLFARNALEIGMPKFQEATQNQPTPK